MLRHFIKNAAIYGYVTLAGGIILNGLVITGHLPYGLANEISLLLFGASTVAAHAAESPIKKA